MTFRLTYEVVMEQTLPGQAARIVRIEADVEPASDHEVGEAVQAFLTAVTGEREALHRETRRSFGEATMDDEEGM